MGAFIYAFVPLGPTSSNASPQAMVVVGIVTGVIYGMILRRTLRERKETPSKMLDRQVLTGVVLLSVSTIMVIAGVVSALM